jgi:hypothetical protein
MQRNLLKGWSVFLILDNCCRWFIGAEFGVFLLVGVCECPVEGKASGFWGDELMS